MVKSKKYVLITGAASGIGLAITEYLAAKGDFVFASDVNLSNLKQLEGRENISTVFLDVTDNDSIAKAMEKINDITNGLDVLINNAGIFVGGPIIEVSDQDLVKIINVNVIGAHKVTRLAFPLLQKKKGCIINIGSEAGRITFPLNGPYSMTKYALESFSDALRRELMFLDMKVIHLQVGAMKTDFLERTYSCYAEDIDINKTHFPNLIQGVLPICEKEKTKGGNPQIVGRKIHKIIHRKRPKSRYKIKNDRLRRMVEFLPESLVDFAIKKMYK